MNFEVIDNKNFSLNGQSYLRQYFITKKDNGKLRINHFVDNAVLVDNIEISSIMINNNPIENIEDLQRVIFRRNCLCGQNKQQGEENLKIFDDSFEETFE